MSLRVKLLMGFLVVSLIGGGIGLTGILSLNAIKEARRKRRSIEIEAGHETGAPEEDDDD